MLTEHEARKLGYRLVVGEGTGPDDILGRWYIERRDGKTLKGSFLTKEEALRHLSQLLAGRAERPGDSRSPFVTARALR
ncbi:MAG: hypothetical protein RMK15_04240 [Chloroflexota bacterium]|jgi:hypothetical protein|nr:hypothetical protein [Dehalococcoidia bacterium]MDW8046469.1 hypothetical protein [Chloroflexota bacterium]